ncbi:hypothetical protein ACF08M_41365 [Streptomyces sp. NPDC015032]|uniref:hypothetical protein n=1 Tax=Streptomyces sp. NPDC015032 TaxID=3364937 RepID=UPI0036F81C1A
MLRREPMLSFRIFIWQHFTRLTPSEVLDVIPLFHPIWAGADPRTSPSPTATPRTATSAPGPS